MVRRARPARAPARSSPTCASGYVDEFPDEPELVQAAGPSAGRWPGSCTRRQYGRRGAARRGSPHSLLAETVAAHPPAGRQGARRGVGAAEADDQAGRRARHAGDHLRAAGRAVPASARRRSRSPPRSRSSRATTGCTPRASPRGRRRSPRRWWPTSSAAARSATRSPPRSAPRSASWTSGVAADLPATPGLLPRKVRPGTADMTTGPAMTRDEALRAIEVGIETARDLVAAGNKCLLTGDMGIANTTASAALISVFTGADPAEVTGRGTGINDATWQRARSTVVRRALELQPARSGRPLGVLAAIGGLEHAAIVGLLLGGASLRTPVDPGRRERRAPPPWSPARIAPDVLGALLAGHRHRAGSRRGAEHAGPAPPGRPRTCASARAPARAGPAGRRGRGPGDARRRDVRQRGRVRREGMSWSVRRRGWPGPLAGNCPAGPGLTACWSWAGPGPASR